MPEMQALLARLIDGSFMSAEQWQSLPRDQQDKIARMAPEPLLDALVTRGLLTSYQAERIRSGSTHGLVIGNYRVLNRIGAGGMGVVFKAEQIKLQRPVALKLLAHAYAGHARLLQRFWAETRAVAQLQHPHIVAAIDAGEVAGAAAGDPNIPYFVMEYLEGEDLEERVIKSGPLPVPEACKLISQIADALTEAHRTKLIHRDIKPSNIFITSRGQAKLLDFGLARQAERKNITEAGMMLGTIGYMAPEQARDARFVDERADLFSLGCSLYWALSGNHPYDEDGGSIRRPPAMRTLRPEVPIELDDLVRRLLAEKPDDRPKDAVFVYRALMPFLPGNERIAVVQQRSVRVTPTEPRRQRALVVDDAPTVRFMCVQTLQRSGYDVLEACDAGGALEIIAREPIDIAIIDYQLPDMPGSDVLKRIRESPGTQGIKVVMMSGVRDNADLATLRVLGADDCVAKPFTSAQLLNLVRLHLNQKEAQEHTDREVRKLMTENNKLKQQVVVVQTDLTRTRNFLMQTVSELIGERNYISGARALRLQRFCRALTHEAAKSSSYSKEITPEFELLLETWVPLMDIGHLLLPDYLLLKAGELTADERDLMQAHTTLGADLLSRIASKQGGQTGFFHMATAVAKFHHERWNGTGYPDRLVGPEIPLPARLASIADVYDALRSQRVYRPAVDHRTAIRIICDESDGQFDPILVQALLRCEHLFEHIFREMPE